MEEYESAVNAAAESAVLAGESLVRKTRRRGGRRVQPGHGRGFVSFLAGLLAAFALAAGARYWPRRPVPVLPENVGQSSYLDVSIPTYDPGEDVAFSVLPQHGDTLSAREVYQKVNPSVMTVVVEVGEERAAVGTGVIFTSDGYFITNYHVVEGGTACKVVLENGLMCEAQYVAGDPVQDLAVLKMVDQTDLPAAEFGDSDLLSVGDQVYAIGNPLGLELRGTLTDGIVSAINRNVRVDGRTMTLIQTNAALNSGNSGGPLINEYGQVVGINVVKMSSSRSTVEGLGFAIPSAYMSRWINDLLLYGATLPEPALGIMVSTAGEQLEEDLWGIQVQSVAKDSPAEAAGIQEGDYVIEAGGERIASSTDLLRVRRQYYLGDKMPVTLWREGQRLEVIVAFPAE